MNEDQQRDEWLALAERQAETHRRLQARSQFMHRWFYRSGALLLVSVFPTAGALFLAFGQGGSDWRWVQSFGQVMVALAVLCLLPINACPPLFRERSWFDYGLIGSQVCVVVGMLNFAAHNTLVLYWGPSELTETLLLAAIAMIVFSMAFMAVSWHHRAWRRG